MSWKLFTFVADHVSKWPDEKMPVFQVSQGIWSAGLVRYDYDDNEFAWHPADIIKSVNTAELREIADFCEQMKNTWPEPGKAEVHE